MNRGARGWQEMPRAVFVRVNRGFTVLPHEAVRYRIQEGMPPDVGALDMVLVNGVWMVPEDAHVAKTGHRAP